MKSIKLEKLAVPSNIPRIAFKETVAFNGDANATFEIIPTVSIGSFKEKAFPTVGNMKATNLSDKAYAIASLLPESVSFETHICYIKDGKPRIFHLGYYSNALNLKEGVSPILKKGTEQKILNWYLNKQ